MTRQDLLNLFPDKDELTRAGQSHYEHLFKIVQHEKITIPEEFAYFAKTIEALYLFKKHIKEEQ